MSDRFDAFVVVAPGLEPLALAEVQRLGVRPARSVKGGIECTVTWPQLYALHLRSRVATRVVVRLARFRADGMRTLRLGAGRVAWSSWLAAPEGVVVRATCDGGSALFHSGAVEEQVADACGLPAGDHEVLVRVVDDVVTVSLDATGPALFKRGWRGPAGKAPLRESLAAALVLASGWDVRRPLVDPFCGSGTVAVEAAMIARRMAPGRHRTFAFQRWATFDDAAWERALRGVDGDVIERCPPIVASDRDAGAIAAARSNAAAAGVGDDIEFVQRPFSDIGWDAWGRPGWMVGNPPWGVRVGGDLRNLYDRLAQVIAGPAAGWGVAMLAPPDGVARRLGLEPTLRTIAGGQAVSVWCRG